MGIESDLFVAMEGCDRMLFRSSGRPLNVIAEWPMALMYGLEKGDRCCGTWINMRLTIIRTRRRLLFLCMTR
jgi:hypothetical protein